MNLLALETSSDACSVALQCNDELLIDHRLAPQQHAKLLLPMVDQLLVDAGIKPTDLDGVALGCGPGSFTGVRIAAAAAQGIAFGVDVGVVRVSSLAALAQSVVREYKATHVLAVLDARMGEVYWGTYVAEHNDSAGIRCNIINEAIASNMTDDCVSAPDAVLLPASTDQTEWMLAGSGVDAHINMFRAAFNMNQVCQHIPGCWPTAQDVLAIALPEAKSGRFVSAADAVPVYLRDRVALTEQERAAGEKL